MPASALVRGAEYPLQIFLSNLAGPLTNAAHDISAVHFQGAGGQADPYLAQGPACCILSASPAPVMQFQKAQSLGAMHVDGEENHLSTEEL